MILPGFASTYSHAVFLYLMHSAYVVLILYLTFRALLSFKCTLRVRPSIPVACVLAHPWGGHISSSGGGNAAAHFSWRAHFLVSCLFFPLNFRLRVAAPGISSVSYWEGQKQTHTHTLIDFEYLHQPSEDQIVLREIMSRVK